ncbi:hypothetical protein BS47DRAFT_1348204 [Hydnum rufescens UP504]|uniref:Wax synthase domain-containing protein n=1 Tax=Hydnum rufescens UP504 TaxID=1448309 RepID=A0A9P6AQW9_9AGAM|nr:hypothetical protein BS47DRAFT_1348204 [Hydnum rufescens UP504]
MKARSEPNIGGLRAAPPDLVRTLLPRFALIWFLYTACIFTHTFPGRGWPWFVRFFLLALTLWALWDFGYGHYLDHDPLVSIHVYPWLSMIPCYVIMQLFMIMNDTPPKWVSLPTGNVLPLPQDTIGRIVYALDLSASITGSSWMRRRRWDFAPSRVVNFRPPTRAVFLMRTIIHFAAYRLLMDGIDTYIKQVPFKATLNEPVSRALPFWDQIFCGLAMGPLICCGMVSVYDLLSIFFVASGLTSPSSWPPFFGEPLLTTSLQDFWSNRWHHIFRRSFTYLGDSLLSLFFSADTTQRFKGIIRPLRVTLTFVMTTLLHIIIMHRYPADPAHPHRYFWDWSIMGFFLIQPVGLAIDACIAHSGIGSGWRRAFAWGFLAWNTRWWADVWVKKGLPTQKVITWSPVRGILFGDWWPAH